MGDDFGGFWFIGYCMVSGELSGSMLMSGASEVFGHIIDE